MRKKEEASFLRRGNHVLLSRVDGKKFAGGEDARGELSAEAAARVEAGGEGFSLETALRIVAEDGVLRPRPDLRPGLPPPGLLQGDEMALRRRTRRTRPSIFPRR